MASLRESVETMERRRRLEALCQQFIDEMAITCPEAVYQKDSVLEGAPALIIGIANIIGYHKPLEAH